MKKINLKNTYGYKNFIDDIDKKYFLNWIQVNENLFKKNEHATNGNNRKYLRLKDIDSEVEEKIQILKNKIIELEQIENWIEEPTFYDYIGINENDGFIQPHMDPNIRGYIHTRWNLILKYPLEGGHSIYGNSVNVLEENMIWKCESGIVTHGSLPVIGEVPRITLSLGFQIKISPVDNSKKTLF